MAEASEPLLKVSPEPLRSIKFIDSSISPIIKELTKDLQTISGLEVPLSDSDAVVLNLCKTLESALRHGLLRTQKDTVDFFDVVLSLYDQQNTLGRKFWSVFGLQITFFDSDHLSADALYNLVLCVIV